MEEKKAPKKHFNIPKETAIKINEIRDQIVMLKTAREGNVETYAEKIDKLSEQKWFLEKIVLDGIGLSLDEKEEKKYVDLHEKLYSETEHALKYYNGLINEEKEDLDIIDKFLETFDGYVEIRTDKKGEIHYDYDLNFFNVILAFARTTNLGGLF